MNEKVDVSDLNKSLQHFGWPDYVVFLAMLAGSAVIGIYFGFVEKKSKNKLLRCDLQESEVAQEYLMGGRQMSVFPVAVSLVASWISGISLLGLGTEMYLYGTAFIFSVLSVIISGIIIRFVLLPVFYNLQLTSTYEYLEMRFDKRVRLLSSILYTIATISFLPIVIYVPALAFNQDPYEVLLFGPIVLTILLFTFTKSVEPSRTSEVVVKDVLRMQMLNKTVVDKSRSAVEFWKKKLTGVNIHVVTPFVCVVCIFYTLVGGLKAVVWTDCVQMILMLLSMTVIIVKGTIDLSGLQTVWNRNYDGGRLNFPQLTWDLTERHSVLSLLIGGVTFYIYTCGMGQEMLQRYVSLPTMKDANRALLIFVILLSTLMLICCYNGLLVYAWYAGCDPLKTKLISAPDQLLPLLLMSVLGDYPGMPGLFIAGIFSAALSTLSTSLNSMAAIVLEDFVKPFAKTRLSEKQTNYVMRGTVLVIGIISVSLVFVVQHMGTVLQLSMTLSSMSGAPIFGMFAMGLLCPWVKRRGAFTGAIVALIVMIWMLICAQRDIATGELKFAVKQLTTDGCNYTFSRVAESANLTLQVHEGSSFRIHHMSYIFYPIFGALVAIIVGSLTSLISNEKVEFDLDPMLFSPFVRRFITVRAVQSDLDERSCVSHAFNAKDTQL